MARRLPESMTRAIWAMRAVMLLTGVAALLTRVFEDDLVLAWAEGNQAAQEVIAEGGLQALRESSINIPGFVAVSVVLFIVWASLAGVLLVFFRGGHEWARLSLTALAVFGIFATAVALTRSLPPLFVALGVATLLLYVAFLVLCWQRPTTAYLRHGPASLDL
jgi:hypothetical protein